MSTTNADPPALHIGARVVVRPQGGDQRPWVGVVVPGLHDECLPGSFFQPVVTPEPAAPRSYLAVRCLDPCDAAGIVAGHEYLVLQRFARPFTRKPRRRQP